MMEDMFVITKIYAAPAKWPDNQRLTKEQHAKYSGKNIVIETNRIFKENAVELDGTTYKTNIGSSNIPALDAFDPFIIGFESGGKTGLIVLSNQLKPGATFRMKYREETRNGSLHMVPLEILEFIGYVDVSKKKKSGRKSNPLF